MSRVGKHPVAVPSGVEVQLSGQTLSAKGSLGTLRLVVSNEVTASIADGAVTIAPKNETKHARAMWGTTRALVNNMVTGVSKGFSVTLEINGVGYRAAVQGRHAQSAARLQPRHRVSDPQRRQDRLRTADPDHGQRRRPPARRPDRGRDPRLPSARTLQGQGDQILDRDRPPQGRQEEVSRCPRKPKPSFCAGGSGCGAICAAPPTTGRASRCFARRSTSMRKSSTTRPDALWRRPRPSTAGSRPSLKTGADIAAASAVGKLVAERAKAAGVEQVVFDRGAYLFHGRVKALADAAREGGLDF